MRIYQSVVSDFLIDSNSVLIMAIFNTLIAAHLFLLGGLNTF